MEDLEALPTRLTSPLIEATRKQAPACNCTAYDVDTYTGHGRFSIVVAFFIILTTAGTVLHAHGMHGYRKHPRMTAQRLEADCRASSRSALFALGIVGTGLLAVPVLAGSAAYAVGETMQWRIGLELEPQLARGFYAVIAVATLVGTAMNFIDVNPIKALFWTAVINGVIAVPMLAAVMLLAARESTMGTFAISGRLKAMGWLTTAVMAACVVGMVAT